MWSVSQRFLDTIPKHHQLVTTCTATPWGGSPITLRVQSGQTTSDRSQRIRRVSNLTVLGGSTLYDQLSQPGTRVFLDHGFAWSGTDRELVPMIRGELSVASLRLGSGVISFTVADLWQRLAASDYLTPYTPSITARRIDAITTAVLEALPGNTIRVTASDTGTVATTQVWTSRADMINSLATDGGMEAFFAPDGAFVLRDIPTLTTPAAWIIKTGAGGTLGDLTRNRPLDRLYNTVILTPATSDDKQGWTQVVVQITDTNDPRHPNRIGVRPFRYAAPSILTEAGALNVATQILAKVKGTTETLSLGALSNPALESGDIVRALTPLDGGLDLVSHFLEQVTIDHLTGSMNASTRSNTEINS